LRRLPEILGDEDKAKIIGTKAREFAFKNFRVIPVAEKLSKILEE